jgi:4-aminobutyrate aminotransferase-like enzyme
LREVADVHPSVRRIDGRGLHWTVELHGPDWRTWAGADAGPTPASIVQAKALDAGVLMSTSGEQTSVFLAPPLIAGEKHLRTIVDALDVALSAAERLGSSPT